MALKLPQLIANPAIQVDVQQTSFSHDLLGRFVCNSPDEVLKILTS